VKDKNILIQKRTELQDQQAKIITNQISNQTKAQTRANE
jgi:hypothetical protein